MNQELIDMAKQVGLFEITREGYEIFYPENLEAFAALVAAAEREACAGICDRFQMRDVGMQPAECAGAIRARGEKK